MFATDLHFFCSVAIFNMLIGASETDPTDPTGKRRNIKKTMTNIDLQESLSLNVYGHEVLYKLKGIALHHGSDGTGGNTQTSSTLNLK